MSINTILIIVSTIGVVAACIVMYLTAKGRKQIIYEEEYDTIEKVVEGVKREMVEIVKEDITIGTTDEEFERLFKRKARINDALKKCVFGIDSAKMLVIDLIRDFIDEHVEDIYVDKMLGLDEDSEPSDHIMFEIMMYKYKKRYGKNALAEWIKKNHFDRERISPDSTRIQDKAYYITVEDLQQSYLEENFKLTMDEKKDVLAVLVYQLYKGFGIIDTLREMNINGFNMGTSGSILSAVNNAKNVLERANNAVWLYFEGKYIHLKFMNFGNEEELRRIIQLLIRYNNPGALTAKRGYLVNTMYDKSRILALRPPASEYWAVFVRKFNLSNVSPESLIIKEYTKNGEICVKLIEYLMRGQITCAVTGRQGSGKTTLMSAIIRYIDPRYTIRVLEMAPELYLRELYPTRNILSVQETTTVTAQELQDALKKSDAAVSIVGEVATDAIAARMIQMGMTASLFTIFSHHANTPKDLVLTLRNSLVNDGGFSNMETAEKQVTDVVRVDIHLNYTPSGKRYIERISEIVQLDSNIPYEDFTENMPVRQEGESAEEFLSRLREYELKLATYKAKLDQDYYYRSTDRISFTVRQIMHYDLDTDTYICDDRFSPETEAKIKNNLGKELALEFDYFMLRNWGIRKDVDDNEIIDFDLDSTLRNMEQQIEINRKEEEKLMAQGNRAIITAKEAAENGTEDNVEDLIDFADSIGALKLDNETINLADEFTIGLFDTDIYGENDSGEGNENDE